MKRHLAMLMGIGVLALFPASSMASSLNADSCQNPHECFMDSSNNTEVNTESYAPFTGQPTLYRDQGYVDRHGKFYNARFPRQVKATGHKFFVFSPRMRQWAAYDSTGQLLRTGRANGGNSFCDDLGRACHSPRGWYRVHSKGSSSCISRKFPIGKGGAPMPYCMYFKGGYAIHGSPYISQYNGSHGCIRVTTDAAQWLSQNFMHVGTKVLILPY